jgi:DNA polymerase III, gamma/tau subunits
MDNFIVSARKYRPATFASVVGQSHITSTLKNAISRGQLAHAYLFCGPRGVGRPPARVSSPKRSTASTRPQIPKRATNANRAKPSTKTARSTSHELDAAVNNSVDDIAT